MKENNSKEFENNLDLENDEFIDISSFLESILRNKKLVFLVFWDFPLFFL